MDLSLLRKRETSHFNLEIFAAKFDLGKRIRNWFKLSGQTTLNKFSSSSQVDV